MTAGERAPGACSPAGEPAGRDMVDVILDLVAERLPPDFEPALFREVARIVPWIARESAAGIHPVRGNRAADGSLLIARRAKLVIRLPRDKVCAASVLEQATLAVNGTPLRLGQGTYRRLQAAQTLYSPRVVTGDDDEVAFTETIEAEIRRLGVRGSLICGRRTRIAREGRELAAWSLAIHGLAAEASLVLQHAGLGSHRDIGCGILVPHKTIHTYD
jgi:CRISPR-associated protein Cas6